MSVAGFIPTPDGVYRIDHIMVWAGKRMSCGYYKQMTTSSPGGLSAILDHFANSWYNNIFNNASGVIAGPIQCVEHTLRDTGVSDGGVTIITTTAHTGGTAATTVETVPIGSAMVISMRSGLIGRSRRGRNYWPAVAAAHWDPATAQWTTSTVSGVETVLSAWEEDSNSTVSGIVSSSQFVVASRQINGVPQNPRHITPINLMQPNVFAGSQRRRSPAHHGRLR